MFDNLRGLTQKRTQLHFRDDGQFQFRKLPIEDGFLVEKEKDIIVKAWMMIYKLQKRFRGYGRIGSDLVTLSYDRDILLDPHSQLTTEDETPAKGGDLKKQFIKDIATAKCYRHEHGKKKRTLADTLLVFMGTGFVIGLLLIGMQIAMKGGN